MPIQIPLVTGVHNDASNLDYGWISNSALVDVLWTARGLSRSFSKGLPSSLQSVYGHDNWHIASHECQKHWAEILLQFIHVETIAEANYL